MNTLQLYTYESQNVRTVAKDGEPWFVAADLCSVLGIRNPRDAIASLDEDEKGVASTDTLGGQQKSTIVNEGGMYSLVLRSRKPEAKAFKRWLTHEVIPSSIRKTGSYSAVPATMDFNDPQRQLFEAGLAALNRAESGEAQLAIAAPKVEASETFMGAANDYDIRDEAQLLQNETGIKFGQNLSFHWHRDNGWISESNRPYQPYLKAGLLALKAPTFVCRYSSDGSPVFTDPQVRVTSKGLERFAP